MLSPAVALMALEELTHTILLHAHFDHLVWWGEALSAARGGAATALISNFLKAAFNFCTYFFEHEKTVRS
jgi:hypothetical protein